MRWHALWYKKGVQNGQKPRASGLDRSYQMIKSLLSVAVILTVTSGAAFAQGTTPPAKESVGTKIKNAPGAVVKDTESGFKKVGRGTKKAVTGTGREMGKLTHIHKKKAAPKATTPATPQ
jgi:hypothetical protein